MNTDSSDPAKAQISPSEALLLEKARAVSENMDAKARIRQKMMRSINESTVFVDVRSSINPVSETKQSIWKTIASRVAPSESVWNEVGSVINPSVDMRETLWGRILSRMHPVPVRASRTTRFVTWTVAVAVVVASVRLSPLLFLSPTIAESPVLLMPIQGEVSVLIGGLWQPVSSQTQLRESALIKTGKDSKATLLLHDDAVLRFDENSTVAIHDLIDRPKSSSYDPSMTLYGGRMWIQSFVPAPLDGFTVATAQGDVYVNEGSVSIAQGCCGLATDRVTVDVYDRSAKVFASSHMVTVDAGESVEPYDDHALSVFTTPYDSFDSAWTQDNFEKDTIHRHEMAKLQQDRRASAAGILPTSPVLYAAKRITEKVNVLLSFSEEERAQKLLDQANTRLNEAAAMMQQGDAGADVPLQEFKQTVLEVASGSGGSALVTSLAAEQMAETAADVSAALPDDASYALKAAVKEASAQLPVAQATPVEVASTKFMNELGAIRTQIEKGNLTDARDSFAKLQDSIDASTEQDPLSTLSDELRKEAEVSLKNLSMTLGSSSSSESSDTTEFADKVLTDDQLDAFVRRIVQRINIYEQPRSQFNQLMLEMQGLKNHPQRVSILRRLLHAVPTDELSHFVMLQLDSLKTESSSSSQ